jgi:hypothetical protein
MLPPNGRGPPARFDAADGPQERLGKRLDNDFTLRPRPAQNVPRERLMHLARAIHPLGERALYELFCELAAGAPVLPRLERFAEIGHLSAFIAANDGDRLPAPKCIAGGRR